MRYICVIIGLLLLSIASSAQENARSWSFVLLSDDAIIVYEPASDNFRTVTTQPEGSLSLSPNSLYMTYTESILPDPNDYVGPPTTDIYMIDLVTGETRLIAGQSDDKDKYPQGIHREFPVWSPDGNQIAWTEGLEASELYLADLITGEIRLLSSFVPSQTAVPTVAKITTWSPVNGILVEHVDFDATNSRIASFDFYQTNGTINIVQNPFESVTDYQIMKTTAGERLAVNTGLDWFLIDPQNATVPPQPLTRGIFGLAQALYPNSLITTPAKIYVSSDVTRPVSTDVYTAAGNYLTTLNEDGNLPFTYNSIVNDAQTIILMYDNNGDVVLYDIAHGTYTLDIEGGWSIMSPAGYTSVLIPDEQVFHTDRYCKDNTLSMRLFKTGKGYVLPDTANNIRVSPTINAEVSGVIPIEDFFDVLDGPQCNDGYTWWKVDYLGTIGWTAEAGDDEYWLAPGCPTVNCVRG